MAATTGNYDSVRLKANLKSV